LERWAASAHAGTGGVGLVERPGANKPRRWRANSRFRARDGAPATGKSTLNRLELSREVAPRPHKFSHDPAAIEALFADLFLEARATPPKQIVPRVRLPVAQPTFRRQEEHRQEIEDRRHRPCRPGA
jgi:hypothetical protein